MKLLRYGQLGAERPALLDGKGQIRDLSAHIADIAGAALSPASLTRLAQLDVAQLPLVESDVRIGACVGGVGKVVCISLNYRDHAAEVDQDIPKEPVVLLKATSSLCGPYDAVHIPRGSDKLDWEVELAVVIGMGGKYIRREDAARHIAGYCIMNDISARDFQLERGGTWDKGKSADTFGPLGPWLVTPDEVTSTDNLELWLEVDGHRYQNGNTSSMVFGVEELVSYVSGFMSLQPGDIISTSTPPGNGLAQNPPVFLKPGDVMHLGISHLGEQRQIVRRD